MALARAAAPIGPKIANPVILSDAEFLFDGSSIIPIVAEQANTVVSSTGVT
jgi:hypothetical protein